jgi:hypothetical protein
MGNFQETLSSLQPYVIGIRYVDSVPVIDTIFKNGWILPDSKVIKKVKGNDAQTNYYMIYSDHEGIGLDEVLDYIKIVINVNLEREEKHALLKEKVEELKVFFKQNSLTDLKGMRFVLGNENVIPKSEEIQLHEIDPVIEQPIEIPQQPLGLTEEEIEMDLEEQRAEKNRILAKQQREQQAVKKHQKVELPPRQKEPEMEYASAGCNCGPDEACSKCIDSKEY